MITAGVDCGAKNVKVVILEDGEVRGRASTPAGMDTAAAAEQAYDTALAAASLTRADVVTVVGTGAGKGEAQFADTEVTEVGADARGIHHLHPDVRTVVDVGNEEGRAIKVDAAGRVADFAINEKCAAGAGAFTEAMARALEVPLEEFGELSLQSNNPIPINAQCAVFAESEVVSLVHRKTSKPDMARAIHDAIADRITSMVRRVGVEERIALIGGVARNVGFVRSLTEDLETELVIPEDMDYVGAIGAALVAADNNAGQGNTEDA
ncbi:MAG: acyl-CoA dehydratase activase [Planctomycetota bacterium]|jgi:benzoyl-CoA reductase subunit D